MGALTQMSGWVELLAGDPRAAERELRIGVELLRGIGELAWLSSTAAILAEALYDQGNLSEAKRFIQESESAAGSEDVYSQALLRSVRAKILSDEGHAEDAAETAREAVNIAEGSDFMFLRVAVLTALGEVLASTGSTEEADSAFLGAEELCEVIGFTVGAERARTLRSGSLPGPRSHPS
jgi:tetratricopeptide (TPR) repeat protein